MPRSWLLQSLSPVVGTLERSQGWVYLHVQPLSFPLCVFLAELLLPYLVRLNASRPVKGLSDISLSSWPPPMLQEMSWFINSLQKQ